jgi:pimeloyl-ACP methyl ester carboxylesterase
VHLNAFADSTNPLEMTVTEEFESLLTSARELGIPHAPDVRYHSRNIVLRHRRFHLLEWGQPSSPPVILLHGGHQSAHSWDLVSLSLADRYHVFALDQRGHGDSEWSRDGDYSSAAMAEDVLAFIASEGIAQPILFGHSMGGMVTLNLLRLAPTLPKAVVLVDIGPEVNPRGTSMIREFIKSAVEFDDLEEFVARVRAYDPFRSKEHIERTVRYNMLRRADGKYVSKCDRNFAAPEADRGLRMSLDDVRDFQLPVLVVRGEQSNILEPEAADRFVTALPAGKLVTVPDCGHNVHSQNTSGFLDAVAPFLRGLARANAAQA